MGSKSRRPPEWPVLLENLPAMIQRHLGRGAHRGASPLQADTRSMSFEAHTSVPASKLVIAVNLFARGGRGPCSFLQTAIERHKG